MKISRDDRECPWLADIPTENISIDPMLSMDFSDILRHGCLVGSLARLVSEKMGEGEEFRREISIAGTFHDIGKLKLGRYLYGRKKDSLNIEEMKYVRMHPTFSYNILKKNGNFSENIINAVYAHHENYDGSGYPNNLKGDEIPKMARIIRTCDVFVALVSKRPYRAEFEIETAIELMIDEVKNFDMKVFLAFQQIVNGPELAVVKKRIDYFNNIHKMTAGHFAEEIPGAVAERILTDSSDVSKPTGSPDESSEAVTGSPNGTSGAVAV